jgi:hypothetical protein
VSMKGSQIVLPPGVSISPGRETVQAGPSGNTIQGMNFTLTLLNGATTTVFVPYNLLSNIPVVQDMFDQRINAINGVVGGGV